MNIKRCREHHTSGKWRAEKVACNMEQENNWPCKKEALNNHFRRESERKTHPWSQIWATVQAEPPKILYFFLTVYDNGIWEKDSCLTLISIYYFSRLVWVFGDHYFLPQIDNKTNGMSFYKELDALSLLSLSHSLLGQWLCNAMMNIEQSTPTTFVFLLLF